MRVELCAMRLLAAALLTGLALVAGSIAFHAIETRDESPYANAEDIARVWFNTICFRVASTRHVSGPFVHLKAGDGHCYLIDVSTQYQGKDGPDQFWVATTSTDADQIDC